MGCEIDIKVFDRRWFLKVTGASPLPGSASTQARDGMPRSPA